ncbi:MAG: pilus assembly protein [Chloroflexi bacterium]|nr:pilus assembly protein [Chloroflexota bacterium]
MVHHSHHEVTQRKSIGRTDQRGVAAIEIVLVIGVLILLFFGAVEIAREISVKHALDVGTYRATRYISLVPSDTETARLLIQRELDANVLGGAGTVQMTVSMPSQSFQQTVTITAQVPYTPVVPFMVFAPKLLSVTHAQSIEKYP